MRWLALFAVLLLAPLSAHALTPAQRIVLLSNPCAGVVVEASFGNNAPNCYNGSRVSSPLGIPGWSFSGGATSGTGNSGTQEFCNGAFYPFASGVPRITPCGLSVYQASTNSFLNSATGTTQTVTTTAASWTLSFNGTGSFVGAGSCTISLAGTGAANRVSVTVTATVGSCVLTDTGLTTNVQFEASSFPTPYIPTTSAAVTRSADVAYVSGLVAPASYTLIATGNSAYLAGSYFPATASLNISGSTANEFLVATTNSGYSGTRPAANLEIGNVTVGGTQAGTFTPGATLKVVSTVTPTVLNLAAAGAAGTPVTGGVLAWNRLTVGARAFNATQINGQVQYVRVLSGAAPNYAQLSAAP
jgi:hypothetical protein